MRQYIKLKRKYTFLRHRIFFLFEKLFSEQFRTKTVFPDFPRIDIPFWSEPVWTLCWNASLLNTSICYNFPKIVDPSFAYHHPSRKWICWGCWVQQGETPNVWRTGEQDHFYTLITGTDQKKNNIMLYYVNIVLRCIIFFFFQPKL